ncbi:MAG: flavin reductase family protein [Dehalococcoidia bacterium]|nr:flavin reductase family protein [Dehalococcoidia bacterium]
MADGTQSDQTGAAIDSREFRNAMGMFATGVTVVAVQYDDMVRGMTANAFLSLSLHPAMVLICIDESASMHPVFQVAESFSVNILTEDQQHLSRSFAARGEKQEPMGGHPYRTGELGSPILDGVLAWAECRVEQRYPGGDHLIVVGRVHDFGIEQPEGAPLVFYGGRYHSLGEAQEQP